MKLVGSSTSPFVRRIRILLARLGCSYEFSDLNIYGEDRDQLRAVSPALKIPVLIHDDKTIYDSRIISRYLFELHPLAQFSWEQENHLTLIDAVNDSMVTLLLAGRSGLDTTTDITFFNLQKERIKLSLDALEALVGDSAFEVWDYRAISLYCCVDWANFRELMNLEEYPQIADWMQRNADRPSVVETDPRKAA